MYYYDVLSLKRITGMAPLQLFGEAAVKNDRSQLLKFFLPVFGFIEKELNLGLPVAVPDGC